MDEYFNICFCFFYFFEFDFCFWEWIVEIRRDVKIKSLVIQKFDFVLFKSQSYKKTSCLKKTKTVLNSLIDFDQWRPRIFFLLPQMWRMNKAIRQF